MQAQAVIIWWVMARNYSTTANKKINATSATELPLVLLEIDHPDLATPVRVVQDNQDITSNADVYTALAFNISMPDDLSSGQPRARLALGNVGRELVQWLESSGGGRGATCHIMQVLRSVPNTVEWEVTMNLNNVQMNMLQVTGELTFDDILNLPAVPKMYTPTVAPGLF